MISCRKFGNLVLAMIKANGTYLCSCHLIAVCEIEHFAAAIRQCYHLVEAVLVSCKKIQNYLLENQDAIQIVMHGAGWCCLNSVGTV
jgi:hypothetical protein